MHMVSKRDLHSAEWETIRISKNLTTVLTANGEVRGSWVYLPLEERSKTTSHPKWQKNHLQCSVLHTFRCPWPVDEFLYFIFT